MLSTRHEVFLQVAKEKSFSKAAAVLFISQPAISKHIKALEQEYKTKLFERKGLHIEPTAVGSLLFEKLLQVKNIQEQTAHDISLLSNAMQVEGRLKLGASTTVALYILPKVLSQFHQQYPNIDISVLNRNTESVLNALINKEINLGIIEGNGRLSNIDYMPFTTDKVIAVCSAKSPLARKKIYTIQDIAQMPIALRERGSGTLAVLKSVLEQHGIKENELQVKVKLGGTEALKNFIIESDCLGFLPQRSVMKELRYGELVSIEFEGLNIERSFYFIQRMGENSNLNKIFIKTAKKEYNI
ncbi:LysR substrate-binding domain-containing protein [Parasediminibacterium sp. JCM 36343]|uniref:LysR substrate-binding domain-containing protein n=1 Tax=Parasediminibacterium sp. JCM 36343 TaxID=3374279 RepID=UPI003978710F